MNSPRGHRLRVCGTAQQQRSERRIGAHQMPHSASGRYMPCARRTASAARDVRHRCNVDEIVFRASNATLYFHTALTQTVDRQRLPFHQAQNFAAQTSKTLSSAACGFCWGTCVWRLGRSAVLSLGCQDMNDRRLCDRSHDFVPLRACAVCEEDAVTADQAAHQRSRLAT